MSTLIQRLINCKNNVKCAEKGSILLTWRRELHTAWFLFYNEVEATIKL